MKRSALLLSIAVCGCAEWSSAPPPGPRPLPPAWRPATELRELRARLSLGAKRETVLDERDGLSPDEAAILAVDQNPRLRVARAEHGLGQAELLAAGVLPNPRLDAAVNVPTSKDATVLGYGVGLSWNVTPLLSRGARVSAAQENLVSVDLDIAWQEWQVAQAARLHTIRALYLLRRVQIARELEQTWQQRLDGLRQARALGAVTELEATNAERSLADARVNRLELEQRLVAERVELNRTLGIEAMKEVVLDTSFSPAGTAASSDLLLEELPRRRLDLIALQHAHRSHDEALRAAVIARFPAVEIVFQTARDVDGPTSAGVGLRFDLPFFDRNQSAVARERALRIRVEAEYDARLGEARADVLRAVKELALVREQLAAARDGAQAAIKLAEQARAAAVSGALSPLIAADVLERAYSSRLRTLEIEQTLAELQVALALASGRQP